MPKKGGVGDAAARSVLRDGRGRRAELSRDLFPLIRSEVQTRRTDDAAPGACSVRRPASASRNSSETKTTPSPAVDTCGRGVPPLEAGPRDREGGVTSRASRPRRQQTRLEFFARRASSSRTRAALRSRETIVWTSRRSPRRGRPARHRHGVRGSRRGGGPLGLDLHLEEHARGGPHGRRQECWVCIDPASRSTPSGRRGAALRLRSPVERGSVAASTRAPRGARRRGGPSRPH